jgi:hypothetical protein
MHKIQLPSYIYKGQIANVKEIKKAGIDGEINGYDFVGEYACENNCTYLTNGKHTGHFQYRECLQA